MRDVLVTVIIVGSLPFILRRPVIGVFMWVWISVMSPHRLTWGFAYDQPFAMLVALTTIFAMLLHRDRREFPLTRTTIVLILFILWMNVTTVFALDHDLALPMLEKVMKTFIMVLVVLYLVIEKKDIEILTWVTTLSLAYYGFKGGMFVLRGGGENRVYGPAGSFIEENNSLALATIMIIPMLLYLARRVKDYSLRWGMQRRLRWAMIGGAILCGFSVLGSHSRGGFLAVGVMLGFLWLKTKNKILTGLVMLMIVPFAINFMPDEWTKRMETITEYQEDGSAMGRINAWTMALNLTRDRPITGGGFEIYTQSVFNRWAPNPTVHAAHSIYFSILGEHGYVGLMLFLLFWFFVWRDASFIIQQTRKRNGWAWANELARMIQVGLVGYAVGGAFLSLAYYDLPYYMAAIVVVTRRLLQKEVDTTKERDWYGFRSISARTAAVNAADRAPAHPMNGAGGRRAR